MIPRIFTKTVVVIVAHPCDETLWTGGTILSNPFWEWFIICLCRKRDNERFSRFNTALKIFNSEGIMGNLDDGPDQKPLKGKVVEHAIMDLLPKKHFDLIITHNPSGEYTRHLRHEEVSRAVINLWQKGDILANELWTFAYENGTEDYDPRPIKTAPIYNLLNRYTWLKKCWMVTEIYGIEKNSFEAQTTPRAEAFWRFENQKDAQKWLENGNVEDKCLI